MSGQPGARPTAPGAPSSYLPDFCEARAVFVVVLVALLVAVVLALARQNGLDDFWIELARTSSYLVWTGLACAGALCKAGPRLARQPVRTASTAALGLIIGTVAVVSECFYGLGLVWESWLGVPSDLFPAQHWSFLLPNLFIAAIVGGMALRYFYVSHEWRRNVELEARARVRALQARIRPHFLYNSLNTVAALTRSDPARAEEAIEDLADLFRVSLSDSRAQITLREELEVARMYQRIEQLRLGDRLQVRWKVGELPPRAIVPSLLLQPLLENAINHGIEPLPEGGTVTVEGSVEGNDVTIEVHNPVSSVARAVRSGNRMALDNIRQRLELVFPGRSAVEVVDSAGEYKVRLRFPLELGNGEADGRK
jgi:two-component system sensor histidine kinase AlgZ